MEDKPSKIEEESAALEQSDADAAAHKEPKAKKPKKAKALKATKIHFKLGDLDLTEKEYGKVVIPSDENDPHWDPKLKNAVPEGLVEGMAEFGWDPSSRAVAIPVEGGKFKIIHGKTRWRALEKANKLRQKLGEEPIIARLHVVSETGDDEATIITNMRRNVRLNRHVQEIDHMTLAESMFRALSSGQEEKQVAKDHAVTVNDLHAHMIFMDESQFPAAAQEALREGKLPYAAAQEIARQSKDRTKAELLELVEKTVKAANLGAKLSTKDVQRAAGKGGEEHPATKKEIKQAILDVQSDPVEGKQGYGATWGFIVAVEMCLGTRSMKQAMNALAKIGKGEHIKVDFKQYQTDGKKEDENPVKGQEKK